jgi:hypothetical protein
VNSHLRWSDAAFPSILLPTGARHTIVVHRLAALDFDVLMLDDESLNLLPTAMGDTSKYTRTQSQTSLCDVRQ